MKTKILHNKEEELLSRNKVDAEVEFDAAVPARKDVITKLAESLGVAPDLVVVKKIEVIFGSQKAKVLAYSYKSVEDRNKIEEKKMLVKTGFNIPKIEKKAAPVAQ